MGCRGQYNELRREVGDRALFDLCLESICIRDEVLGDLSGLNQGREGKLFNPFAWMDLTFTLEFEELEPEETVETIEDYDYDYSESRTGVKRPSKQRTKKPKWETEKEDYEQERAKLRKWEAEKAEYEYEREKCSNGRPKKLSTNTSVKKGANGRPKKLNMNTRG